jgi:GNAT superfamily N-acetyltransferase
MPHWRRRRGNISASPVLKLEPLSKSHDRQAFDCGVEELNHFLRQTARQHMEKGLSVTTVMTDSEAPETLLGFYTLSFCEIEPSGLPPQFAKKYPSHRLPAVKLARLGVATAMKGKGLGKALLMEAMRDAALVAAKVSGVALVVDAKDGMAAAFYARYGFAALPDAPLHLMMPMKEVQAAVALMR